MANGSYQQAAETALTARMASRAAALLEESAKAGEHPSDQVWARVTAGLLVEAGPAAAEAFARRGLARMADSDHLLMVLGVALRRQRRLDAAAEALEAARRIAPDNAAVLFNLANVHCDRGDGAAAEATVRSLIPLEPVNPELRHLLARARRAQGDYDGADAALGEALDLDPTYLDAWRDRAVLASERQHHDKALAIIEEAIVRIPGEPRLIERQAELLLRAGRRDDARLCLEAVLAKQPDAAWACNKLAQILSDSDVFAALGFAERAMALAPNDAAYAFNRADICFRASGSGRPDLLQTAAEIVEAITAGRPPPAEHAFVTRVVLAQVGAVDRLEGVGDFEGLGRYWVMNGQHAGLFGQLPLADTPERRRELLQQHRLWGRVVERRAGQNPVGRPPRRGKRTPLRVGFLSSDLRRHPVGYFAQDLFDHYDRDRFELYAYSFYPGPADDVQARIAGQIAGFRSWSGMAEREAASRIAADDLDILIDLGGATRWNYAQILAYQPAPVQASWLGSPHSVGLEAIDHLILDPHLAPTAPDLLLEHPLLMPHSWIAMGRRAFGDQPPVAPAPPSLRADAIMFGTASNPAKYNRATLAAWARVVAQTPGSRFLFVRAEADVPAFRANVTRQFAEAGVAAERIGFQSIAGGHLVHYGLMDISLDTFPFTGGTTTCESLWMGVPVVSLRGEAIYQRQSHSILTNAGLADLSVETVDDYVETAVRLAQDGPRLADLRRTLRARLRASPLGDSEAFTRDFFDLIARTLGG